MPHDRRDSADLDACRDLLHRRSKSFALAARLLPPRVRDGATALYAFCRVADDRIDEDPAASDTAVDELRERLRRAYAGRPDETPVDRALAAVVARERIPLSLPDALLEGLGWDVAGRRYETLDDLYGYAARVAGTVGAMMTLVMGPREATVLARACDLGVAMQLTNIARDVGEDAARGRVYLPISWLQDGGIDPDALVRRPTPTDALARVVARLLAEADTLYTRADGGIAALPPDCRVAIRAARLIYAEIGRAIARARFDTITRRATVPGWRKLWLLARALPARWTRLPLPSAPPLDRARFLVAACAETA